jgi:hypothetical protein
MFATLLQKLAARLPALALPAAVVAISLLSPSVAQGHPGGRYGTASDMESALKRNRNFLSVICFGFGAPRRRLPGGYEQFQEYKHFHCQVIINSPYRQLCLTVHTLRNGRILFTKVVLAGDARQGDCG